MSFPFLFFFSEAEKSLVFFTEITSIPTYAIVDTHEHHKRGLNNLSSKQHVERKEQKKKDQ